MGVQVGPFLDPDPDGPKCYFLTKLKDQTLSILVECPFLHVYYICWGAYREIYRRVSMNALISSLDG